MPKRITIEPHLGESDLLGLYHQSKNSSERSRYLVILLLSQDLPVAKVATVSGYNQRWIYELVRNYNQLGPLSLKDKRHCHSGPKTLLNDSQQDQLWEVLQQPAPDGGLWTGLKVAAWMSQLLSRHVTAQRGWEYLRRLGSRSRKPSANRKITSKPKDIQR